ncbi:TOS4 [Candida pseudojiufengensis]|uniref:TOS4 n=1 Tax=Candida pseudojiufengensis TaxID=497109 RepID=UPI002224A5C6|nr:TOS4 [Candida pseudojiufengensis]KAI5964598.1 TOS4 [Candida pseudojiufengensis]
MSYNYQFPPSSPLHDSVGDQDFKKNNDPFAIKEKKFQSISQQRIGRDEYPTPNPSSSLFRSSSPARDDTFNRSCEKEIDKVQEAIETKEKCKTSISINKDFNILNPDKHITRIPLLSEENHFSIGRSSNSCDYTLDAKDSFISRVHIKIGYTKDQIIIECKGSNGASVIIPKSCFVHSTIKKNTYLISEFQKDNKHLNTSNVKSKSIKLTSNYTEFYIHKNESIVLPRFENIMLEISKQIILINPCDVEENLTEDDDELTDDEKPILKNNEEKEANNHNQKVEESTPINKLYLSSSIPNTPSKPKNEILIDENDDYETPSKPKNETIRVEKDETPSKEQELARNVQFENLNKGQAPLQQEEKKHMVTIMHPKPNKLTSQFKIFQNNNDLTQQRSSSVSPKLVLKDKTNTIRRALSEEPKINKYETHPPIENHDQDQNENENHDQQPPLKKKKKSTTTISHQEQQTNSEIEDQSVLSLPNISEIKNIFINHLAFSRLSSTPISILNSISQLTSNLTNSEIKIILNNINCIGIIYRKGKDAAGKPLEEEYYYIHEKDEDLNRKNLVENIKGNGGLRSCRKVHKQYYWKKPAPIKK